MMLNSEYKDMTQLCLDAERWSAAAGSIYTVPKGKIKFAFTKCYTLKYNPECFKTHSLLDKISWREKILPHNVKINQFPGC